MLSIHKILVPIVLADSSRHVVHPAVTGAQLSYGGDPAARGDTSQLSRRYPERGHEITARDLHAHIVQRDLEQALRPEFDEITVTRVLLRGDPAHEIVRTARDQNVDLIVMSTRVEGSLYRFLLGPVTAKVLHETHCPLWTGAHLEDTSQFSFRHVLCSVGLNGHSRHTASLAAEMAAAGFATEEIAKLQPDVGTRAEVIIDRGNVPEPLNRAAERTKADVLFIGHIPWRSHLGDNGNGYGTIRESHIPVLSV